MLRMMATALVPTATMATTVQKTMLENVYPPGNKVLLRPVDSCVRAAEK